MNVRSWSMSERTIRWASGYCTLIAIGVPSGQVPVCTWPRLAAAMASGSTVVPCGRPVTSGWTFDHGRGSAFSYSRVRDSIAAACSGGSVEENSARIWPNFSAGPRAFASAAVSASTDEAMALP